MKKKVLSAVTAGVLALSMAAPVVTAFAETVNDDTQVTLTGNKTPKGTVISITVPTTIPLAVNASTHTITTGNNLTIKNAATGTGAKNANITGVTISDTSSQFTFVGSSLGSEVGKETSENKVYAKIYDASNASMSFTLNDTTKSFTGWQVPKEGGIVTLSAEGDTGALSDNYSDEAIATISWTFTDANN